MVSEVASLTVEKISSKVEENLKNSLNFLEHKYEMAGAILSDNLGSVNHRKYTSLLSSRLPIGMNEVLCQCFGKGAAMSCLSRLVVLKYSGGKADSFPKEEINLNF